MTLPLPAETALLSTVTPAQGKTERKDLLGSGRWRSALHMRNLESTWVCDGCQPGAGERGGRVDLWHVPLVLPCCARGDRGTRGCRGGYRLGQAGRMAAAAPAGLGVIGKRFGLSQGTPPGPDLASWRHPPSGAFPPPVPLSLHPGRLPPLRPPCHRCASVCNQSDAAPWGRPSSPPAPHSDLLL